MKKVCLVFVGGAIGAIAREFFMLLTPVLDDKFPLDIFLANILAAFLLGLAAAANTRQKLSNNAYLFIGTGIMGGLSTFSSFVYGAVVLMSISTQSLLVAIVYLLLSIIIGYIAVALGHKLAS